jgi:putative oligomerization/nucleic acid binding protein
MRRRRPLMRAAMVGGGAYVAGKHVAKGQAEDASQEQRIADLEAQQAAAAPPAAAPVAAPPVAAPPAAAPADDLTSQLMDLKNLMDQGVLSPEEFQQAKAKLLGS